VSHISWICLRVYGFGLPIRDPRGGLTARMSSIRSASIARCSRSQPTNGRIIPSRCATVVGLSPRLTRVAR
jgi:hypothetical protein